MSQRCITIEAASESEAMQQACQTFDAPAQYLSLTLQAPRQYVACQIHGDAAVEIIISEDEMQATAGAYTPPFGDGAPLSATSLVKLLTRAGIRMPPPPSVINRCVEAVRAGEDIAGTVLVRGREPEDARDATIIPVGDWRYPVIPNEEIGLIVQAAPSKNGVSVTGKSLPPTYEGSGKPIDFPAGCNCRIDQRTFSIRTEVFGQVELQGQTIYVKDWIKVSPDAMRVTGTVHHRDNAGNILTRERMQQALAALGIVASLEARSYENALAKAMETDQAINNVLLCKGTPPLHGQDGTFEFTAEDKRHVVGLLSEGDRMDFRARGAIRAVEKGTILGHIKPPVPGLVGRDVHGNVLPAREGQPCLVAARENVVYKTGTRTFVATETGVVVFAHNAIAVTDVYEVQGDVNIAVGNITLEKGSLHVRGSILSGFTIEVPGNILVDHVVENSRITAGGAVEIRGGILMECGGFIKAGSDVAAVFAMNATIEAGGDVSIKHELTNCIVKAEGRVLATNGRGKIAGSTVHAARGVMAQEVGSELGVATVIVLGKESVRDQQRFARKRELEGVIRKITAGLGKDSDVAILKRTPPEKLPTIGRLLQTRNKAALELLDIERAISEEREAQRAAFLATRLKVNKTLWPGVVIHAAGTQHRVAHAVQHCQVYYDPDQKQMVMLSL
ncbi:FapA family protein [Megalodesulfovibrio gigas]|uniref:FapA family protein n=1 Tax=Megalodesulfovibrio gigas TaxID=879 RepID=UPI000481AF97|nr:FapA family protein [Megalodesulfovibrio gigas]